MKTFLQAAFKITWFQVILIAIMSGIKYIFTTYAIIEKIQQPFIWICLSAGVLFLFAVGIMGYIENKGSSLEAWKSDPQKSPFEKLMAGLASWGFAIPAVLGYFIFLYLIMPTTILMLIALYLGIVIRNCFAYYKEKQERQSPE